MSGFPMFDFSSAPAYNQVIDLAGGANPVYIGWATPSVAGTDKKWKIRKLTYQTDSNGNLQVAQIMYANNDVGFNFAWDSRTTYTYTVVS